MGARAGNFLNNVHQRVLAAEHRARKAGVKIPARTAEDELFFPIFFRPMRIGALEKRLAKAISEQPGLVGPVHPGAFDDAMSLVRGRMARGKVSTLDSLLQEEASNIFGGTSMRQLLERGVPIIERPSHSLFLYMSQLDHLTNVASRFGPNGELINVAAKAARAEGADPEFVTGILNHVLGRNYSNEWGRQFAKVATNFQTATKLTFASIPQATQTVANNPLMFGVRNTVKGMSDGLGLSGRSARHELDRTLAINAKSFDTHLQSLGGGEFIEGDFSARIADWALRGTGFEGLEKFNRYSAGSAAFHGLRQIMAESTTGRVRGSTAVRYRQAFADAGLDLGALVKRQKATDVDVFQDPRIRAEVRRAVFRLARRTQFTPGAAIRPVFWSTNPGRVMFQFNTFALNQTRLIRDQVLAQAALGNYKPLAYVLSFYPIAGEFVNTTRAALTGRDRPDTEVARVLDNFAAVGAFGIGQSIMFAMRYGDITSALGPTFSDVSKVWRQVVSPTFVDGPKAGLDGMAEYASRVPIVKGAGVVLNVAEAFKDLVYDGVPEEEITFNAVSSDRIEEIGNIFLDDAQEESTMTLEEFRRSLE
jgi:hypothetical protein